MPFGDGTSPLGTGVKKLRSHWRRRVLTRLVRDDPPHPRPLTLMMPVAPKDVARARRSVESVRARLAHPLARIVIIAPDRAETRALAADLGADFIDEAPHLEALIGPAALAGLHGWHKQQFLKLSAPEATGDDHVLCIDSDTVINRRTAFLTPDHRLILLSAESALSNYVGFAEKLIGPTRPAHFGYVAHAMLFRAEDLAALRACIEARSGKPWVQAVLAAIAGAEAKNMSEFELLARFLLRDRPEHVRTRYYAGREVSEAAFFGRAPLPRRAAGLRFLSSHEHAY